MKTITEDITLSPGINEAELSPESLSTLIDVWTMLHTTTIEAVQMPTVNIFSFSESCSFFAVILENGKKPDVGAEPLGEIQAEELERTARQSAREATWAGANIRSTHHASSSAARPNRWDERPTRETDSSSRENALLYNSVFDMDTEDDSADELNLGRSSPTSEADIPEISYSNRSSYIADTFPSIPSCHPSMINTARAPNNDYNWGAPASNIYWLNAGPLTTNYSRPLSPQPEPALGPIHSMGERSATAMKKAIGIVYLTITPNENVPAGEANVGVVLIPEARGKSFARQAIDLVLTWGFEEAGLHRIQAGIIDSPCKDKTVSLFTQM